MVGFIRLDFGIFGVINSRANQGHQSQDTQVYRLHRLEIHRNLRCHASQVQGMLVVW